MDSPASAASLLEVRDGAVGAVLGAHGSALPVPHLSGVALRRHTEHGPWLVSHGYGTITAYVPVFAGSTLLALLVARVEDDDHDRAVLAAHESFGAWTGLAADAAPSLGELLADAESRQQRLRQVERAVVHRQFHPVFQPVVDLTDGTPAGYEALTRFTDGRAPRDWFAQAAEVGRLGDLELATAQAALLRGGTGDQWLAINLSATTLRDPRLAAIVAMARRPLVLEMHLPAIDDPLAVVSALQALPGQVALAVDSGRGRGQSLTDVLALAPAFVKLHTSLISGIDGDAPRRDEIRALVEQADQQEVTLIAQGIETRAERDSLAQLGVRLGQGWLFGTPA